MSSVEAFSSCICTSVKDRTPLNWAWDSFCQPVNTSSTWPTPLASERSWRFVMPVRDPKHIFFRPSAWALTVTPASPLSYTTCWPSWLVMKSSLRLRVPRLCRVSDPAAFWMYASTGNQVYSSYLSMYASFCLKTDTSICDCGTRLLGIEFSARRSCQRSSTSCIPKMIRADTIQNITNVKTQRSKCKIKNHSWKNCFIQIRNPDTKQSSIEQDLTDEILWNNLEIFQLSPAISWCFWRKSIRSGAFIPPKVLLRVFCREVKAYYSMPEVVQKASHNWNSISKNCQCNAIKEALPNLLLATKVNII